MDSNILTDYRFYLETREVFTAYLNQHRYELESKDATQQVELEFYSKLIDQFNNWFYTAIVESTTGAVWKQLVALQVSYFIII